MHFGPSLVVMAIVSGGTAFGQSPVELYRRVTPLETTTGVISIRESIARELDVPDKCDDDSMECETTRKFARVWRIDFEVETQRDMNGEALVEREARGTAFLALAAEREDEESYDAYLRDALAGLGAAAFEEPYAGLRPDRRPFNGPVANGSARNVTRYSRELTVGSDGAEHVSGTSSSGYRDEKTTGPLCSTLAAATDGAYPEIVRTMSTPRRLVEEVLSVDVSDLLSPNLYGDELVPLPEGSWLLRKAAPGVEHSTGLSSRNEVIESRLAVDELEISGQILPAELPVGAARANVWHSRWTLEKVERRLGPFPEARLMDSWSLTVSLLPTWPPRDGDSEEPAETGRPNEDTSYPVRLDQAAFFARVGESLDFRAEMSPAVLADVIVRKISGLDSAGWILVVCRDDEEATWGLAPTHGRASLLNGDSFCGTVASYLP